MNGVRKKENKKEVKERKLEILEYCELFSQSQN